ncbi:TonB-dependent receptor [Chitinophaga sp. CC14]|uniref:outer membrane beta-barrel protein n=1 Tax=Chitinophaga sp. CC14 TaxID=3029199 RepID=UPI003B7A7809
MRFVFSSALLLGFVCPALSQISGTVTHKVTRLPLNQAGLLLSGQAGSIVFKTATDASGNFLFTMPPAGEYRLTVSFLGFDPKTIALKISQGTASLQLDSITLAPAPLDLSQVEVKAAPPMVRMRGDTLEFNASYFHAAEKASLLNLFQKVPGLTIDVDGNFYFQGIPISELYIDGRPAFQNAPDGNADPKTISRLLLAGIVDKIQVISKKQTSGIHGPSAQKMINITIKKESKRGATGEIGAGYGSHDSYKASATAARFREHSQLIGVATFANVSSMTPVSSSDESMDMNMRFPGATRDGKIALSAGFDAGKKSKFNFTLNHMDRDGNLQQEQQRENFLNGSSYDYNRISLKKNQLQANMLGANFSCDFNDKNKFTLRSDLFLTRSNTAENNTYITRARNHLDTISYGNFSNSDYQQDNRIFLFSEYTHQFTSTGMLRLAINYDFDHHHSDQYNYSLNLAPVEQVGDTINQRIRPQVRNHNLMLSSQLFKPLGKRFEFQLVYNLTTGQIRNEQLAQNYNDPVKRYELTDTLLSYLFENTSLAHLLHAAVGYHIGKLNVSLGATLGMNDFKSSGDAADFNISQQYNYLSPVLGISWKISPYSALRADLSASPLLPVTEQLTPVISVQNPLQVQLGNPDLKPGYSRRISLDYNYSSTTGTSFSIGGFATLEYNGISTSVFSDSSGKQISRPINVNGTRAFSPTLNFGKRLQKAGITIGYRAFGDFRRSISLIDGLQNMNHSVFLNQDISFSWNYKSLFELGANAQINYRGNKYAAQTNRYTHFTDQRIFLKAVFFLPAGIQIGSAGMYTKNTGVPGNATLINGWISKLLSKERNWLLKCYGFDLLNESKAQTAIISPVFIERTLSNSQPQYFMCSLTRYFK